MPDEPNAFPLMESAGKDRPLLQSVPGAGEGARQSSEQLRLALSAANLGDWHWEAATDLVDLSGRAAEIFGVSPGKHLTREQLRHLLHPEDRPLAVSAAQAATTPGVDYDVEYRILRSDGSQRWVAAKGRYVYGEGGVITSMLGVVQDITERKKESAATQYLAAIVESSEDAIVSKNLEGIVTSWNAGAERLFGYSAAEIVGKPVTLLIPPGKQHEEPGIIGRIRAGERIDHYETVRLHKNGKLIDVSLTVSPIKDANNRIIGASKIARNITEQKKTEAELLRRERLYRAIGDSIDYGIWVCDAEGRNIYASPSFLKLVGLTQEECSNSDWRRVLHPDDREGTLAAWAKVCREGTFWEREYRCKGADGRWHPILARGVPVHDAGGQIVSWVGINLDIRAFKEAEKKLKQAREELLEHSRKLEHRVEERTTELKETNNQLETLVYSIAHDLRAPLRSMQAYSQTLLEDYASGLDETAQHYARRIVHSAETMDALVLDLLAYGRIARSEMFLEPLNLESIWKAARQQYEKDIEEKHAEIETVLPLPRVMGNEVTLGQALANLLGNALKFTAPGAIPFIRLRTETQDRFVRIWIEDNGIGIDPEYHERIFRVFERLQGQAYPGTGIGLSIVRKGIERMGGRTGVESIPGKGSRFWIELPAAPS